MGFVLANDEMPAASCRGTHLAATSLQRDKVCFISNESDRTFHLLTIKALIAIKVVCFFSSAEIIKKPL